MGLNCEVLLFVVRDISLSTAAASFMKRRSIRVKDLNKQNKKNSSYKVANVKTQAPYSNPYFQAAS
jgi:hypothetical protein